MTNNANAGTIGQLIFTKGMASMTEVRHRATVPGPPPAQGLYDPRCEHDACGVGFVVDIKGRRSHTIVRQALRVLINLLHRGACGCEANTGDGAGVLLQVPDKFLRRECDRLGIPLPPPKEYGCGLVFLPRDPEQRDRVRALLHSIVDEEGQRLLGWRDVPTDDHLIGASALSVEPHITQVLIGRGPAVRDHAHFERKLYVIRKLFEKAVVALDIPENTFAYMPSLSSNTLIYKGMLSADQIETMYPDLADPDVESALALVHQRFSTNTFPSWPLAHPYRYVAHNGEINTLRGNINWMRAREALCRTEALGDDLKKVLPVTRDGLSDSATFDNVLEFLVMNGRSLPHAILMMIPEPWQNHESMSPERRAFYEYHSSLMEPWDGPASIAFTDGTVIGAVLDRNGLRPSRYYVTKDDMVIMASEVGVLDVPPDQVSMKGRLQPGRMLLVDTGQGRIVDDDELKQQIATEHPYRQWLSDNLIELDQLPAPLHVNETDHATVLRRQQVFGYTHEDLKLLMTPMGAEGNEAIGSMGTDTPLAVLSAKSQLLYNYFKQLFAQVTNPPVDAIREELIMSTDTTIGPEANMLEPTPECARQIKLPSPILTNEELEKLRLLGDADSGSGQKDFKSITLPMLFKVDNGRRGLEQAMADLCYQASAAIASGYEIIILSDRGVDRDHAPVPALLAVSGVHHHLIREGTRTQVGFVIESGEPREVHHFALLLGYGAAAINPYLAFETLHDMVNQGLLAGVAEAEATGCADYEKAIKNYI